MSEQTIKRARGRPPKGDDSLFGRINIRIPKEMDDYIRQRANERMDRPEMAVVIRELLALGIEQDKKNRP